jgi:hypothetical protein
MGWSIHPTFYAYVANNPTGQTDPSGMCPCGYHKVRLYYMRLATNFGPVAEVNFGPPSEA